MDSSAFRPGEYLTFRLAGQEFAIDATRVKGIVPMHDMETVDSQAGSPHWLIGRASVHGLTCQVLDLARWLGLARGAQGRNPYIVVVQSAGGEEREILGFPVDRVCDVVLARARDFSHGKLRMGRARRVLYADRIFHEPAPAQTSAPGLTPAAGPQ